MRLLSLILPLLLTSILAACAPPARITPDPRPTAAMRDSLLPAEPPPQGASGVFRTDFSLHTVHYAEILSGGPSKDDIPPIDTPKFVSTADADLWLRPNEPVILVGVGEEMHAYPIRIIIWHELVNDAIGGRPVLVSYCPLCNTAIAFGREVAGRTLDFGTTGYLRYSNLIMYDRQTESWWQQASGRSIAGAYAGTPLDLLPARLLPWSDIRDAHPDAKILSSLTGYSRDYGRNPYAGYDDIT